MRARVYVCVRVWKNVCLGVRRGVSVSMCVSVCAFVYVCVGVYVCVFVRARVPECVLIKTACMCMLMCAFPCYFVSLVVVVVAAAAAAAVVVVLAGLHSV